jgi:hypothetical protein
MKNIVGAIVEKENFFGREREIKHAWELLNNGHSLLLAAPRRVGKSSFASKMKEVCDGNGWKGFYMDLEKSKTEMDFIKRFLTVLKGESWFEKFKADHFKVDHLLIKGTVIDWSVVIKENDVYQKIEKVLPYGEDTLIVLDELTIFLDNLLANNETENLGSVSSFLYWLRGLRQEHVGSRIRWIFCSSVSIRNFAHKYNLSGAFNDMEEFLIDELKGEEPALFVKELAKSKKMVFPDEEIRYLLDKLEWKLPYYIQLMLKEIGDVAESKTVSKRTIDLAFKNATSPKSIRFNTWIERLKNYGEDKPYALLLLKECAKVKSGQSGEILLTLIYNRVNDKCRAEDILNRLLLMLENEGYIMRMRGKYTFRSPMLREFWFNRYVN